MSRPTLRELVLSRLIIDPETGCLLWTGRMNPAGYGVIKAGTRPEFIHRLMYQWFVGAIPEGLEIDHLCRNRICAAPAHLEAVTHAENLRRSPVTFSTIYGSKTHCPQGHPYDAVNTRTYRRKRYCRLCVIAHGRARRHRNALT